MHEWEPRHGPGLSSLWSQPRTSQFSHRDEHRGELTGRPCRHGGGERGVEGLDDPRLGKSGGDLGVAKLSAETMSESKVSKFSGLVMSTITFPARVAPRCWRTPLTAGYGTARTTTSSVTCVAASS